MTDAQGEYELELSMEHDESESTLGAATSRLTSRAPAVVHDEAVPLELNVRSYGTVSVLPLVSCGPR